MSNLTDRRGRVVDADGLPVPGARIVIVYSSVPMPEIAIVSDANGSFSLKLPTGCFTFRAHGLGGTSGEVEVEGSLNAGEIVIVIGR